MMIDPNHELDGHGDGCFTPLERKKLLALRKEVCRRGGDVLECQTDWPGVRASHRDHMCDPKLPRDDGMPWHRVGAWLRVLEMELLWYHANHDDGEGDETEWAA